MKTHTSISYYALIFLYIGITFAEITRVVVIDPITWIRAATKVINELLLTFEKTHLKLGYLL